MDNKVKEDIRNWALQNALKYNGKANQGAVIGKLLAEHPKLKSELKTIGQEIVDGNMLKLNPTFEKYLDKQGLIQTHTDED